MILLRKLIKRIRADGLTRAIRHSFNYLQFVLKIKLTAFILKFLRIFREPPLVVCHGKYNLYFNDDGDYEEILYNAHWKKYFNEEYEKIKPYIQNGETALDIGSNLGIFTLILSDLIGADGKVYSFEPSAAAFYKLNKIIRLNNLNNVETFRLGMGRKEDEIELYYNPQQSGLSSIVERVTENCIPERIRIITLDSFINYLPGKVSFIKIDTEGYEPDVLIGGTNLIQKYKPAIYIELGGKYQEYSYAAIDILKKHNYECDAFSINLANIPPGTNFIALPLEYKNK
jgi:FkbM family methyltransferase